MGVTGVLGIHTGVQHITAAQAILPKVRCAFAVVLGEHLLPADGASDFFDHKISFTNPKGTALGYINQNNFIIEVVASILVAKTA